jgi:NAD(P)-dependent dehydrogenase (short-subunit alcohol dehydrogenase family)|tara:strand:- start:1644 stop:2387 length:744 start_codon:yes stop_codon:yes gene_type:complete
MFNVTDKVVCVTGASGGIGMAIARFLANQGAMVVGVARRESELRHWSESTEGRTAFVVTDLADRSLMPANIAQIESHFGAPDILINAAGINTREAADDVTGAGWDVTMNINLMAPFFLAQGLVPAMKRKGWGRIINFASLQSRRAFPAGLAYGASKGGVEQLTRAMAEAWSSHGINANALAPGFFPTELTEAVFSDPVRSNRNAQQTCIGRNGEMHDLHGPILFFCSSASDYVTGETLFVDGGFNAK